MLSEAEAGVPVNDLCRQYNVDNGTEFVSEVFKTWAKTHDIHLHFIQPGKSAQNGLIERFNRTFREGVLDMNWFSHLKEVKRLSLEWLVIYNEERPHESLAGLAPVVFAKQSNTSKKTSGLYF